jgi:hypothetical protein
VASMGFLGGINTARHSRNQTQLQRLKPTEGNFDSTGLKPGPPRRFKNYARGATNLRISGTEDTEKNHRAAEPQPKMCARCKHFDG